ncbi:MAG: AAA family ATPase [Saprospiraceae bacterium]
MNRFIDKLEIKNFKSIRHLKLSCSKINILVGKPNVGKSNILEALSLLGAGYSSIDKNFLSEFIRYENLSNLFYDQDTRNSIEINTDGAGCALMRFLETEQQFELILTKEKSDAKRLSDSIKRRDSFFAQINRNGTDPKWAAIYNVKANGINNFRKETVNTFPSPVRKYDFKKHEKHELITNAYSFLNPPSGENLVKIIQTNSSLRKEIGTIFSEYGLELVVDVQNNGLEIQKREDGIVIKTPYSLVADTLRRYIFHYAAILSNQGGILLLEEPEAHSFPPYIRAMTERIIESSESNQFFIATHSPYLLNTIIQEVKREDLRIWVATFENYETVIKELSEQDINQLSDYDVDIFFNLNWFMNEGAADIA